MASVRIVSKMTITYICPEYDFETYTYEECLKAILKELVKFAKANPKKYIIIDQYGPIHIKIRDDEVPNRYDRIVDKIGGKIDNGVITVYGSKRVYGSRYPIEWTKTIKVKETKKKKVSPFGL